MTEDNSTLIQCRPGGGGWQSVVLLVVCALFPRFADWLGGHHASSSVRVLSTSVAALFGLPALWLTAWLLRARIVADERGLRWRGLGRWRVAEWQDVTDFYTRLLPKGKAQAVTETRAGRVCFGAGLWPDCPALRESVSQRATQARAHSWETWGARPALDWPRTFHYRTADNRALPVMLAFLVAVMAWLAAGSARSAARSVALAGWTWWDMGAPLLGVAPLALFSLLPALRARDTYKRRAQRITLTQEGIGYEDGAARMAAAWEDVQAYSLAAGRGWDMTARHAIRTKQGTFDFTQAISEVLVLRQAIAARAVAAPPTAWRAPDDDALGGREGRWSGHCEGIGERVFHYRTRTNRALLWLPTALLLAMGLLACAGVTRVDWPVGFALAVLLGWGWWRYFVASVRVGDDDLTQYGLFGRRHVAWEDITDYVRSGDDIFTFGNVIGENTRIRFWLGIADAEELKQEIARRAVNCPRHDWDRKQKTTHTANGVSSVPD